MSAVPDCLRDDQAIRALLASIGIDIGKEVFHIVGLGTDGKVAFRRKVKRLAIVEAFKKFPPCVVGMERAWVRTLSAGLCGSWAIGDLCKAVREGAEERLHRRRDDC